MNVVAYDFPLCDNLLAGIRIQYFFWKNTQWELTKGRETSCLVIQKGGEKKKTHKRRKREKENDDDQLVCFLSI